MSFAHPLRFAVAVAAAALLSLLYARLSARRTALDLAYSNVEFFAVAARPRAWIPKALDAGFIAALLALAFALGGLQVLAPVPVRDGVVFICIDTSGSMAATDIVPTRAAAARSAARAFIEEAAPGTRIGLVAFSATASIVQQPSSDRPVVEAALNAIPQPNGGTAIGDALRVAASALPATGHRLVVLVTDGVSNTGSDPQEAARLLGVQHIPIYTIGIGTPNGGVIPGSSDEATIDEGALQYYADASGGAYARAENATQLRDALARLGRITSFAPRKVDASRALVAVGVSLLLGTFLALFGLGKL